MADPISLVGAIVGLVAQCASAARSLKDLKDKYTGAPAAVLMLSIECTTTSAVLERLKDLMQRNPKLLQPTRPGGKDLYGSFSTLVREITETVKLVLSEIQRSSTRNKHGTLDMTASSRARFIWNEGFFVDSLQSVRSLRSSVVLMLECLQMESLVKIQLRVEGSTSKPSAKPVTQTSRAQDTRAMSGATPSLPRATIKISLRKESDEPAVQMILSKARLVKGHTLKNSSGRAIKLHTAIDNLDDQEVTRMLADRYDPNMRLDSAGLSPLHRAVRTSPSKTKKASKRELIIKSLICFGARLDDRDEEGRTPLMFLIYNKDDEALVRLVCEFGSPVNAQDTVKRTALHYVCPHFQRTHLIRVLVAHGADVNLKQKDGKSPLYVAADKGNESAVAKLLEFGANPNEVVHQEPDRGTILTRAIKSKDKATVKILCESGVPLDAMYDLPPPLTVAVLEDSVDVVQVLLDAGADVNQRSTIGNPPIYNAAILGNPEMVQYLIKRGANVNEPVRHQHTAVHAAVWERHQEVLKVLLKARAQVDSLNSHGDTPLHMAVEKGFTDMAEILIAFGAYLDYEDDQGAGYLDRAIAARQLESLKFLISSGVDITRRRRGQMAGMTALHTAASMGLDDFVTYLLDHGAELHATRDNLGHTPLHFAIYNGYLSTVRILADRGASLDILSENNVNLLSFAVKHPPMLTYLLNVGKLDPNHRGSGGATALTSAAYYGVLVSVRILLQRGARQYCATEFYDDPEDYFAKKNALKGTPASIARQMGHIEVANLIDEWAY